MLTLSSLFAAGIFPGKQPIATASGGDPVHFSMIRLTNLSIGLMMPPVGTVLFIASAVSKQKIKQVVGTMLLFYGMLIVVLMLITSIPAILLGLPRLTGVM